LKRHSLTRCLIGVGRIASLNFFVHGVLSLNIHVIPPL
jgi:hypothetical protein